MASGLTRKQYILRGRLLRTFLRVVGLLQRIGAKKKPRSQHQEIVIDTPFGKVRTLWYGFENTNTAPVFFDLHGGGFMLGSADMDEEMNVEWQKQVGCKVISIDYAKAPDHPYPAAVNQVYAVVKHVYENADQYHIDPARMAIGGHSAGGNLSAVTCLKAVKEGQFRFACQILDYPPLDLATSPLDKPNPKGAISPQMAMIFDACYVDPGQAKDPYVSPVYALPQDLQGLPPALVIVAGRDSLHDEGMKYAQQLQAAGVVTECYEYPDSAHGFTYNPSDDARDARAKMAAFLNRHLMAVH